MGLNKRDEEQIWNTMMEGRRRLGPDPEDHPSVYRRMQIEFTNICLLISWILAKLKVDQDGHPELQTQRSTAELREELKAVQQKLAESETREKELASQIVKVHTDHQSAIREIRNLAQGNIWKRLLLSRAAEIVILLTLIFTITPLLMKHYTGVSAREAAKQTAEAEKQTAILSKVANDPAAMVEFVKITMDLAEKTNKSNATWSAIANMLHLPESAIAYQSGKMVMRLNKGDVEYSVHGPNAYLTFENSLPDLHGAGETAEEKIRAVEAAKKKADGK
jgi:hypothetical protein